MDKTLKGSLEGVLPMTGLLILAAILATQSLPVAEALASVLDESSSDISSSSIAHAKGDYLEENFIPDAGNYSLNNAAYFLGKDDAGISWDSPLDGPAEIYSKMEDRWHQESNNRLSSYIEDSTSCEIRNQLDLEVYPDTDQTNIFNSRINGTNFSVSNEASENAYSVKCSTSRYKKPEYEFSGSSPNRYAVLANFTAEFFNETERYFEQASIEPTYSASRTRCPDIPDTEFVEDDAFDNYQDDTPTISDFKSGTSQPENTSFTGSTKDNYNRISVDTDPAGECEYDCPDDDEPGSCSTGDRTKKTVTIEPTNSEVEMEITAQEKLNIDNAWRQISINVDEYVFKHE